MNLQLDELTTLIVGIIALEVGARVRQSVPFLRKIDMPNAVVGAMIVAVLVLLAQVFADFNVTFGSRLRDALLLIFFTSIGLSAKLSALKAGGKPLLILCAVTVVALVAQNVGRHAPGASLGRASGLWRSRRIAVLRRRAGNGDGVGQGIAGSRVSKTRRSSLSARRRWPSSPALWSRVR